MQTLSVSFNHVPPVFKRHHHVVIGIFDEENRLYLARKHVYPANIYRLFGGGVESGEASQAAAVREIQEETSLVTSPILQETFSYTLTEESSNTTYKMAFDLYYAFVHRTRVVPGDDVQGMRIFSIEDMPELLEEMKSLSPNLITARDNETFAWSDWGTVFATLHEYVYTHWPA